jgi:flagellin-like protein
LAPLKYTTTPKGGTKTKMRMLKKSRKALSPVIATIILIAVTVAVSIAVAAWMGALTFSFMGTEQLTVQHITWTVAGFTINVTNSGTKTSTISQVTINYGSAMPVNSPALPYTLKTGRSVLVTAPFTWTNGTSYDISVVTSDGYKFTNNFQGGSNT